MVCVQAGGEICVIAAVRSTLPSLPKFLFVILFLWVLISPMCLTLQDKGHVLQMNG